MKFDSNDGIRMKNFMEEVVFSYIDNLVKESPYCTCPICKMDIAAYVLNRLPPKYVVTEKGEVYSKISQLQQQFEVDVTIAVMKAIKVVGMNPRHSVKKVE